MKQRLSSALLLVGLSLLSGCAGTALPALPALSPRTVMSIREALPNAAYPVDMVSGGVAQLKDGFFEVPIVPDSATTISVQLGKERVFGDLDGNGTEDAVVTLVVDPGGSGTFTYLVPVLNEEGVARSLAAVFLGDRVVLKTLALHAGTVIVTLISRKPDEAMTAEPTVETTHLFTLRGRQLIEIER